MAKDFLDELHEELLKLKDDEAERVYQAIENRRFPPIPLLPHTVLKTVIRVAKDHQMTADELSAVLGMRDVTPADLQLIEDLSKED